MMIKAKVYNCNYETYKKIYKDAVMRAYMIDGIEISADDIQLIIEVLPGNTVQAQRSTTKHTRTISVFENDELKYIIGISNTNYDEDKQKEVDLSGGKYVYGVSQYHSNTYLVQGINKIFNYYYDEKEINSKVKLYFYLLDTDQSYAYNLSNLMNYRKLATIGFIVLNLDQISFKEYEPLGFSLDENIEDIKYISLNKFANDIAYLSKKNIGNVPSYLKCIDNDYDISTEIDDEEIRNNLLHDKKYIYTFKTLSAEGYDSFLTMWVLNILAKKENKTIEFSFATEIYHLCDGKENYRYTTGFTGPIIELIEKAKLDIHYETSDEILHQFERERNQYEIAKRKNILRNQELFKNNLREKGIQTKCYLCGCEIENILEAAHLWGVAEIKNASTDEINDVLKRPAFANIIDRNDSHASEQFYKRYKLANSGDNGIWLCSNHHGLFDSNFFCFDNEDGKILIKLSSKDDEKLFFSLITPYDKIPKEVITQVTKVFIEKRKNIFEKENGAIQYNLDEYI